MLFSHDNVLKIYAIFGILAITLAGGLAPLKLTSLKSSTREYVLAHFSFFTGGVFLGAGLMHMLPDAAEQIGKENFPYMYLLACLGFVAVYSVDKISPEGAPNHAKDTQTKKRELLAVAAGATSEGAGANICYVTIPPKLTYHGGRKTSEPDVHSPLLGGQGRDSLKRLSKTRVLSVGDIGTLGRTRSGSSVCYGNGIYRHGGGPENLHQHHDHDDDEEEASQVLVSQQQSGHSHSHGGESLGHGHSHGGAQEHDEDGLNVHDHDHEGGHHHHVVISGDQVMLPLILALVFSLHSFVAGLALGVQDGFNASALSILIAIVSHKVVEAITVGSNFIKENVSLNVAVPVILVYCFMTPLGITVGMVLTDQIQGEHSIIVQASCQAFAAGSFLYLAVHEIMDSHCCHAVKAPVQVGLLMTGIVAMALIALGE